MLMLGKVRMCVCLCVFMNAKFIRVCVCLLTAIRKMLHIYTQVNTDVGNKSLASYSTFPTQVTHTNAHTWLTLASMSCWHDDI